MGNELKVKHVREIHKNNYFVVKHILLEILYYGKIVIFHLFFMTKN